MDKVNVPSYVHEAHKDNLESQAQLFRAQAAKAESEARVSALALEKAEYEDRKWKAENDFHRIYYFTDSVSEGSVAKCIATLDRFDRFDPECRIEIIFTSPGGSVIDGLRLFDHIQILRRKGHFITIGTTGYAASMAGILLQAGDHRWCAAEAWILIHQVQASAMGSWGELQDRMKWLERVQNRILDIFARRCREAGENGTASRPASRGFLEKNWLRTDWWLSSDESVKYGIVDEVR